MNNYEIKGSCIYSGLSVTRSVNAESESEAIAIARNQGCSKKTIELKSSAAVIAKPVKTEREIIDAEELLYELDAHGVNELTIQEFGKTTSITRAEVLRQIESDLVSVAHLLD